MPAVRGATRGVTNRVSIAGVSAVIATAGGARFVPLTYEAFIDLLRSTAPAPKVASWLDYLERRYIVGS